MKFLFFNTVFYPNKVGGAERSLKILVDGFSKKGIETVVVTLAFKKAEVKTIDKTKVYYERVRNLYNPFVNKEFKGRGIAKIVWHLIDVKNYLVNRRV